MSSSPSEECPRLAMINSPIDIPIHRYVFPCQMVLMISITITAFSFIIRQKQVVVARRTILLLGIANILLLLTMLPQALVTFPFFYENELCRRFVHYTKISVNAWSNIFSCIEVFLTVAICVECYCRSRMMALSKLFDGWRYALLLSFILFSAFLINLYHFFLYDLITGYRCNGSKLVSKLSLNTSLSGRSLSFFSINQALMVVIIPCLVVVFCAKKLMRCDRLPTCNNECQELFSSSDALSNQKNNLKFFLRSMVVGFVISHLFSFFPFVFDLIPFGISPQTHHYIITIVNSCLVTGKIVTYYLLFKVCTELSRTGILSI